MTRSRIHIGPGGLLYLVIAALILGAAVYTQASLLFWSFGLMVGGLGISIVLSVFVLHKVTVARMVPGHGVAGEMLVIRYQLENKKRFLPVFNIVIRELWGDGRRRWKRQLQASRDPHQLAVQPVGWLLHLGPRQVAQAEAACWPSRRGVLRFDRVELSTSFPFGVVTRTLAVRQLDEVLIYPKLHRIKRRLLAQLETAEYSGKRLVNRGGGHEEFFGLRPYRTGDRLKTIDWKHTARTGELVSREYNRPTPPRMMLVLDLEPIEGQKHAEGAEQYLVNAERAISLAASMVCDAHFFGYQIGLAVKGVESLVFPVHHSQPHRAKLLEALSSLNLNKVSSQRPALSTEPSVIIHLGESDNVASNSRCVRLSAVCLERYVRDMQDESVSGAGGYEGAGYYQHVGEEANLAGLNDRVADTTNAHADHEGDN
jgi:uncharacterized protein (DUF58 family)